MSPLCFLHSIQYFENSLVPKERVASLSLAGAQTMRKVEPLAPLCHNET